MRTNKGPYSPQPGSRGAGGRTGGGFMFGQAGQGNAPKPGHNPGSFTPTWNSLPRNVPQQGTPFDHLRGAFQNLRMPDVRGQGMGGGRTSETFGLLGDQFNRGGVTAGPAVTGPGGGIPGLPGYDPNANVQATGGPVLPRPEPALGPGDQAPNQYQGMTGSEIFARLFGQRP